MDQLIARVTTDCGNMGHVPVRKNYIILLNYMSIEILFFSEDDSCSVRTACSTCIEVDGCGWCDSRCVVGNSTEPINNEVPCDQWIYGEDTCNTVSCSAFQTCNVCTSQSNCAWCSSAISTGQPECQTGNVYTTHPIDCSLPDWYPESAECPSILIFKLVLPLK